MGFFVSSVLKIETEPLPKIVPGILRNFRFFVSVNFTLLMYFHKKNSVNRLKYKNNLIDGMDCATNIVSKN